MTESDPNVTLFLKADGQAVAKQVRLYRLRVLEPNGRERTLTIDKPVVRIGSHSENDLVLVDDAVSRLHCEIVVEETGFRLRDLESTNGVFMSGTRIFDAYLRPSSALRLGLTQIQFDLLDEVVETPLASGDHFGPLVGSSAAMRDLFTTLERVSPSDATVLIQGESGTGKELIAEAIHQASSRRGGPFVVFDCASVPSNLMESELFGHEKGAFTGANMRRSGCMEEADGGTLFLDEIGELPLDLQPRLLRAVEKHEVRALGASRPREVNIRIVAATNRDLAKEVNRNTFREDLYYRLAVVRVHAPPLRNRTQDIRLLAGHMLRRALPHDPERAEQLVTAISDESWQRMERHSWPGNVRELRNVIERALALNPDMEEIEPVSSFGVLPAKVWSSSQEESTDPDGQRISFKIDLSLGLLDQKKDLVFSFERSYLTAMLARFSGNYSRAAEAAGIDRMYFKRLLKKHEG